MFERWHMGNTDLAKRTDRIIITVLCAITLGLVCWFAVRSMQAKESRPAADNNHTVTYKDYDGKKIGIATGTNLEAESFKYFPKSEYLYFGGYPDLNTALENGTIDAYLGDEPALKSTHAQQPQIDYIKERLTNNQYSFGFRKNDENAKKLHDQFNEFLRKIKADGTYSEIDSTWFGTDESKKVVDLENLPATNGTFRVVMTPTDEPFCYIKDGKHVGYDVDVAARFCREYGYALQIGDVDFQARIPALESGMYDSTNTLNVTPERQESVLFSDAVSEGGIVVAVRSEDLEQEGGDDAAQSVSSFDGKRAGVITGSFHDKVVEKHLPHSEISNYDSYTDLVEALKKDKIDYFLATSETTASLLEEHPDFIALKEPVQVLDIGAMFAKTDDGQVLKREFDEYLGKIRADGTLSSIEKFWNDPANASTPIDTDGVTDVAGQRVLRFATTGTKVPTSFVVGDKIAGSDPDIAIRFCRDRGYGIEVLPVNFSGIIPGITTGTYDFALTDAVVTPERQESVLFSEPYRNSDLQLVAKRSADATGAKAEDEGNFFERIGQSFHKNFIREDRWKLILQGLGVTCLITVLSVALGSVLALGICLFRRTGSRLANIISDVYVRLLQGTPTVVLLMILYYVVFGKVGLDAVWVAVIGFTLNFGAYGSEIMRSAIEGVPEGQREAALALGYSDKQAFRDFIFPQAAVRFLPVLRGEMINLLKSTSVVGYIAIQDLTKMSDIIRSRTYEAFFPLITTALIYFALAWLLTFAMRRMLNHVDPRARRKSEKEASAR